MSAYIVEDVTINRVVTHLSLVHPGSWTRSHVLAPIMRDASLETPEGCTQLAGEMFLLNCTAVDQRYPNHAATTPEAFRTQDFAFRYVDAADMLQVYKSLECWLYQCDEGNVPETALYKAMAAVRDALAREIIHALPAYDAAQWG